MTAAWAAFSAFRGVGPTVILAGAALVGAVHALLPDHWVPYVVLSKARGWGTRRTLGAVLAGAISHLFSTTALGLTLAYVGAEAVGRIGPTAELTGAAILIVFGAFLTFQSLRARTGGHGGHVHGQPGTRHTGGHRAGTYRGPEGAPTAGPRSHLLLGALLGVRPCAEAVPIFLAATAYGLSSSLLAVATWVVVTLAAMVAVVWLSMTSLRGLRADLVTRWGELFAGLVILLMGFGAALVVALE